MRDNLVVYYPIWFKRLVSRIVQWDIYSFYYFKYDDPPSFILHVVACTLIAWVDDELPWEVVITYIIRFLSFEERKQIQWRVCCWILREVSFLSSLLYYYVWPFKVCEVHKFSTSSDQIGSYYFATYEFWREDLQYQSVWKNTSFKYEN